MLPSLHTSSNGNLQAGVTYDQEYEHLNVVELHDSAAHVSVREHRWTEQSSLTAHSTHTAGNQASVKHVLTCCARVVVVTVLGVCALHRI